MELKRKKIFLVSLRFQTKSEKKGFCQAPGKTSGPQLFCTEPAFGSEDLTKITAAQLPCGRTALPHCSWEARVAHLPLFKGYFKMKGNLEMTALTPI